MTREQALAELHRLKNDPGKADPEAAHSDADEVLLALIDDEEVKAAWDEVPKWYA